MLKFWGLGFIRKLRVFPTPTMSKPLCLVTGNAHKVREFGELVNGRFEWTSQKLDVPEL